MMWFRRNPPPPPKPKTPAWFSIGVPIIAGVILGLITVVYNGIAEELNKKVDNETLQLLIKNQEIQIEQQKKELEQQRESSDEKFKMLIESIKEQKTTTNVTVKQDEEKPSLSPKEFREYLQLSKEERKVFRSLHPSYKSLPE